MAFVTLLLVACITFFLMNAIPGNPWLSEKTPSEATIQALNAKYGLDQPKYIQLGKYLKNLAQGDFGTSIKMQKNRPVIEIIKEMFPVSAKVGSLALLWAVIVVFRWDVSQLLREEPGWTAFCVCCVPSVSPCRDL